MSRTLIWSQLAFDLGDQLVAENSSLWSIHAPLEGPLWVRGIAGVVSPRLVHVTVHHHASPCPSSTVQVTVFALAQGELLQQSTLLLLVQCITLNIIFTTLNMIINFKFISKLVLNNSNAFFHREDLRAQRHFTLTHPSVASTLLLLILLELHRLDPLSLLPLDSTTTTMISKTVFFSEITLRLRNVWQHRELFGIARNYVWSV